LTGRCLGTDYPSRLLIFFGLLSMGISVPFILVQKNIRRLLAYSTIDHGGIMVTALGIGGALGTFGLMLHMSFHTLAKPLIFFCAGNVRQHFKTDLFAEIKIGVLRVIPVTGAIFFIAMLAIVGMPPLSLFQSEFIVVRAALDGGHLLAGALFVLFSTGVFAGVLLHVARMILGSGDGKPVGESRPWRDGSMLALALVLVVIGFWIPAPLLELTHRAAQVVSGR